VTPTNIADAAWLSVDGVAWPSEHSSKT
jgi:hypothetical protein